VVAASLARLANLTSKTGGRSQQTKFQQANNDNYLFHTSQ
jgi:hypothetical protein